MSLNIKNEEVHAAVRALAERLGVSQTSAVETAVREKLVALDSLSARQERSQCFRAALVEAQEAFDGVDLSSVESDLYDERTGLPQ